MAAKNAVEDITAGTWKLLSDGAVASATFLNVGYPTVRIKATATNSAPTNRAGSIPYSADEGETNAALVDLFPGVVTSTGYLWGITGDPTATGKVMISHA